MSRREHGVSRPRQEWEKARENAAYLEKLEHGLAQVHAGQGIVKTMEELLAMEGDLPGER